MVAQSKQSQLRTLLSAVVGGGWRVAPLSNAAVILAVAVSSMAAIVAPVVLGRGVTVATSAGSHPEARNTLVITAVTYAAVWFLGAAGKFVLYLAYGRLEQQLQSRFMVESSSRSQRADPRVRSRLDNGELGFAIDTEAGAVRDCLSGLYLTVVPALIGILAGVAAIWSVGGIGRTLVFVATIAVYFAVSTPLIRTHTKRQGEFFTESMRSFGVLGNSLALWKEAVTFGAVAYLRERYRADRRKVEARAERTYRVTRRLYVSQAGVLASGLLALMLLTIHRSDVSVGEVLGSMVAVAGVCVTALAPLQSLGFGISGIAVAAAQFAESRNKISPRGTDSSGEYVIAPTVVESADTNASHLKIERPDLLCTSLGPDTLDIDAGRPVWVTGPSGTGKTTLLQQLVGVRGGGNAQIQVSRSKSIPEQQVSVFTYLSQEPVLLNATASGNVKFGRDLPLSEVDAILTTLGLAEFGSRGRRARDDIAGELGGTSGGQARRIALARALISDDRQLVVLDEPTAGMDPENRRAVWDEILRVAENTVVIVATHDEQAPILSTDIVLSISSPAIDDLVREGQPR